MTWKPSQEGLYQHFKAIAKSTTLPVMIYNIPGRSVVNIDVDTTIRLSQIENIVCTKEASGDLEAISQIIEGTDNNFYVYSGDDSMTLPMLAIGGNGVVSVASHIIGPELQEMIANFEAGNVKRAAELHRSLLPTMKALFSAPSPAPVKAALEMKGIPAGTLRLPLVPLTDAERLQLQLVIQPTMTFYIS